jgi:predicted metalloprotease with PDZ domain
MTRALRHLVSLTALIGALWSWSPALGAVEYWHVPTFYATAQEAEGAIRNMQDRFVGWEGLPLRRIEVDPMGFRTFGAVDYTETRQQWVYTGLGILGGHNQTVVEPIHEEEVTVVPLRKVRGLRLMNYPELNKKNKWGVSLRVEGASGYEIKTFRTPTRESAETLFNGLISLAVAAGADVELPRLGFAFDDITDADLKGPLKDLGLEKARGIKVTWVIQESPAHLGGLKVGDVLVESNGVPVESVEQWNRDIRGKFSPYEIRVLRKEGPLRVTLTPFPEDRFPKAPPTLTFAQPLQSTAQPQQDSKAPVRLGLSLRLPNQTELQALNGHKGAVISSLTPRGVAEAAGLKVGDVLVECNGSPVTSPEALGELLVNGENQLKVLRGGNLLTFKVAPEVSY